jgi:hypothetical protein
MIRNDKYRSVFKDIKMWFIIKAMQLGNYVISLTDQVQIKNIQGRFEDGSHNERRSIGIAKEI